MSFVCPPIGTRAICSSGRSRMARRLTKWCRKSARRSWCSIVRCSRVIGRSIFRRPLRSPRCSTTAAVKVAASCSSSRNSRPDPLRGDGTGHMLPLKDYGGALGWTYLALRRMIAQRYQRDIRRLIERSQNTWEKRLMERLFKTSVDTVGNTGKSVPFADGGTADADYVPPSYQGRTFQNTHNHFLRYTNDATGRS